MFGGESLQRALQASLITVLLSAPAIALFTLVAYTPSQLPFVVEQATRFGWPLLIAVAVYICFALCASAMIQGRRTLPGWLGLAAFAPTVSTLAVSVFFSGVTFVNSVATILAVVCFLGSVWVIRALKRPAGDRRVSIAVWVGPAIASGVYLSFTTASVFFPVEFPRQVGSLAIFAVFTGALAVVAAMLVLIPRAIPYVIGYCLFAYIFFGGNNHVIPAAQSSMSVVDIPTAFSSWLVNRRDIDVYREKRLPYPVILVSSEGGGIYAAAHAYSVLSTLSLHCPTFAQHVFAVVGVSGGAIGNALFASAMDATQKDHAPCGPSTEEYDIDPLIADHLSPPLARLLLVEPVDRMLPGQWMQRDRAQILADSFLSVAADTAYLERPVTEAFDPESARPAMFSVAVDVSTGRRVVMGPFAQEDYVGTALWWPEISLETEQENQRREISMMNAAGVSARFPWITPTGRLRRADNKELTLADGGYFDNSGAETVLDLVSSLRISDNTRLYTEGFEESHFGVEFPGCLHITLVKNFWLPADWSQCKWPVFVVYIAIASEEPVPAPPNDSEPTADFGVNQVSGQRTNSTEPKQESVNLRPGVNADHQLTQSFLFDPIRALLATRESRAEIALARADLELCGSRISGAECLANPGSSAGMFRSNIAPRSWNLPLGWYISEDRVRHILANTVPQWIFDYRARKEQAVMDLEMMLFHLDPDLHREGADPSINTLLGDP